MWSNMKLNQYLVSKKINQAPFAKDLGVTQSTIHKYLYKDMMPSGKMMMRIHKMTDGDVTIDDWVEHFDG